MENAQQYEAFIEQGRWLWSWTVQRPDWWWCDPAAGEVTRGDRLGGVRFTRAAARRKAARVLAARLRAISPNPTIREYIKEGQA